MSGRRHHHAVHGRHRHRHHHAVHGRHHHHPPHHRVQVRANIVVSNHVLQWIIVLTIKLMDPNLNHQDR